MGELIAAVVIAVALFVGVAFLGNAFGTWLALR
jgi:hypothetical protein